MQCTIQRNQLYPIPVIFFNQGWNVQCGQNFFFFLAPMARSRSRLIKLKSLGMFPGPLYSLFKIFPVIQMFNECCKQFLFQCWQNSIRFIFKSRFQIWYSKTSVICLWFTSINFPGVWAFNNALMSHWDPCADPSQLL